MKTLYWIFLTCVVVVSLVFYSFGFNSTVTHEKIAKTAPVTKNVKIMSKKVTIYTTNSCPYCNKAKILLNKKNVNYEEIDVSNNQVLRESMVKKAGGRKTVPQIFVGELHIGGCDDLYELERQNALDTLLY